MNVPYTTPSGLRIGSRYQCDLRPHHDADALRLQSALITANCDIDWDGAVIGCVCVALAAVLTWVLRS